VVLAGHDGDEAQAYQEAAVWHPQAKTLRDVGADDSGPPVTITVVSFQDVIAVLS
jgi:hypothetical protein